MKRFSMIFLALAAAFTLTACQGSAQSNDAQPLETPGVAPYELSEDQAYLLQAYGLDSNSVAIRFCSPEGAAGVNVNAYTLSDTGEWVENGIGGLFLDEEQAEGGLSGIFTLVMEADGRIALTILQDGSSFKSSTEPVDLSAYSGQSAVFLEEAADAAAGEEIPVLLAGYTAGNALESFALSDYFTPENLSGLDFVQAVTVEFTEEQTD